MFDLCWEILLVALDKEADWLEFGLFFVLTAGFRHSAPLITNDFCLHLSSLLYPRTTIRQHLLPKPSYVLVFTVFTGAETTVPVQIALRSFANTAVVELEFIYFFALSELI